MLQSQLNLFDSYTKRFPGPIADSVSFNFGRYNHHIVFGCLIHGDEVGSLPAINRIIQELSTQKIKYGGIVTFILGNKQAALQEKRFLESDLNRSFSEKNSEQNNTFEKKRALEIMKVLNNSDVFIDFHQTNLRCKKPFYIFEMHLKSYLWARSIGLTEYFVTRKKGEAYNPAGMCSDEYVRKLEKVGITFELGVKGFYKSAELSCLKAIHKSLYRMDQIYLFGKEIKNIARRNSDFTFLERRYSEPFSSPKKILMDGFFNLQKIKKDQILGYDELKKPLRSPYNGFIIFPQYPIRNSEGISIEKNDPYLYSIACKIEDPKLFIS
ncbi:succinylglutamate desuccinylase/aspartoacylase domain-containing protein [Fluviispira vulneris]|uniref:succinylglutamate desuccinylase/aspartoacylase domain-containing protein n=1 Tax=Fluviispira vulneris TaxID=2763012 RepID=UPI001648AB3A|nr:succinylglutamate desuccinylase/aspartoacylase family protein [Fluviispira vulneris]